jgi:hypothetical protein
MKLVRKSYNHREAVGKLVEFWQMAQGYWAVGEGIPADKFQLLDVPEMIECGFAEIMPEGCVRAKGDCEHFRWLKNQREKSIKGANARWKKNASGIPQESHRHQKSAKSDAKHAQELEQELEQERNKNCERVLSLVGRPSPVATAVQTFSNKKFCSENSEIPESDSDFSGENMPSQTSAFKEAELGLQSEIAIQMKLDMESQVKSNTVEVSAVKSDLPCLPAMIQRGPSPRDLAELWNQISGPLPKVVAEKLSDFRKQKARVRLREEPDLDQWKIAIEKLTKWDWGTGNNDRGWVATFDYLLRPGTMVKATEGFFDAKPARRSRPDARRLPQCELEDKYSYTMATLPTEEEMAAMEAEEAANAAQ